jgi:hypothetical protein
MRLYKKYCASHTFKPDVIKKRLFEWKAKYLKRNTKEERLTEPPLARPSAFVVFDGLLDKVCHLPDRPDYDVNLPLRKRKGEQHNLVKKRRARAEKVESLHTVQPTWANVSMGERRAQFLTIEGMWR